MILGPRIGKRQNLLKNLAELGRSAVGEPASRRAGDALPALQTIHLRELVTNAPFRLVITGLF